ncbi:MAG: RagB/SusD family nutrient uptake outer membrane protein [Prevotellaceae bacterium]|jgi:hypothetical protein|nr:RagB/SusD family nutrient uptake outer membrane protein [Prevotellaceae bacterium]
MKRLKSFFEFIKTGLLLMPFLWTLSCREYLDIVPDNTITLEDLFSRREMALNTLSKVYSYIPHDHNPHNTTWIMGDEFVGRLDYDREGGLLRGTKIMRGLQNAQDPLIGLWSGNDGGTNLYNGIRSANTFLQYIDLAGDMSSEEIAEWKAQVKFLKAYYHFLLLLHYGPIVIADDALPLDAPDEELFQKRSKVEDCFDYVIQLMNEAIPDLKQRAADTELGQIDQAVAVSIKARVMLHRASPFFNGNKDYYGDFYDSDGEPFFPLDYKAEKWQDALNAINEAITVCEANGVGLYEFDKNIMTSDREDFALNSDLKTLYDLRMLIVDPWNKELIWGKTYDYGDQYTMASACNIRKPERINGEPTQGGYTENSGFSWQWMSATYKMLERYYTKNGLPIGEDLTFDMDSRLNIVTTPGVDEPEYTPLRGIFQPGKEIVKMYLDRELRFYANLGFTGGYWRSHAYRIPTSMFFGEIAGYSDNHATDHFCTGVGIQKLVHPESKSGGAQLIIRFPYPIIRMADLYLMKAEALNEINGPGPAVWVEINKIRRRAGIPDVEAAWSNPALVRPEFLNKHTDKDGMREIILTERSIEFAFEGGHRFWDMRRYKRATAEFSAPAMGWDYTGDNAEKFFIVKVKQPRRFLVRDYLWPLRLNDLEVNSNLIQNPGW